MTDIVDPASRSQMMAGIKGKNTRPELLIRKKLHSLGFRFRLHNNQLPGKPDIILPKHKAIIFVHGCFWHRHDCHLFKWPSTRCEFWRKKISDNHQRDQNNKALLVKQGWRVLTIWECAIKGKQRLADADLTISIVSWLQSSYQSADIRGKARSEF